MPNLHVYVCMYTRTSSLQEPLLDWNLHPPLGLYSAMFRPFQRTVAQLVGRSVSRSVSIISLATLTQQLKGTVGTELWLETGFVFPKLKFYNFRPTTLSMEPFCNLYHSPADRLVERTSPAKTKNAFIPSITTSNIRTITTAGEMVHNQDPSCQSTTMLFCCFGPGWNPSICKPPGFVRKSNYSLFQNSSE